MKIYTRTGDQGQTLLRRGRKVGKSDCLVKSLGDLDELNSLLGLSLAFSRNRITRKVLSLLQNRIFNVGAELSGWEPAGSSNFRKIEQSDVEQLETYIDQIEKDLKPLKNFILPGGSKSAAFLHVARSVSRRTERTLVELSLRKKMRNPFLLPFLNRISDLLFVLTRVENKKSEKSEKLWKKS